MGGGVNGAARKVGRERKRGTDGAGEGIGAVGPDVCDRMGCVIAGPGTTAKQAVYDSSSDSSVGKSNSLNAAKACGACRRLQFANTEVKGSSMKRKFVSSI